MANNSIKKQIGGGFDKTLPITITNKWDGEAGTVKAFEQQVLDNMRLLGIHEEVMRPMDVKCPEHVRRKMANNWRKDDKQLTQEEIAIFTRYKAQLSAKTAAGEKAHGILVGFITLHVRNAVKHIEDDNSLTTCDKFKQMLDWIVQNYHVDSAANDAALEEDMNAVPRAGCKQTFLENVRHINDIYIQMHAGCGEVKLP